MQVLFRFVVEMLQQHPVILHVVWILWVSELQSQRTSLHDQSFQQAKFFGPTPVRKLPRPNSNTRLGMDFLEYSFKKIRFHFEVKSKNVH